MPLSDERHFSCIKTMNNFLNEFLFTKTIVHLLRIISSLKNQSLCKGIFGLRNYRLP
jgi:hypothetical protein